VKTPESDRGFERFNIAPTQEVLVVVGDGDGRRIEPVRWGLVPSWAKGLNTRFSMINARAETLHEKPAYLGLVRDAKHRCLILADGYYEWQKPEDPRQPRRPMHFALEGGGRSASRACGPAGRHPRATLSLAARSSPAPPTS